MDRLKRNIRGRFDVVELRQYCLFEVGLFWGIIFLCWLAYPAENHYSIMTHTFSFLGSWEAKHNPEWWWLFTAAMLFWASATVPLTLYVHQRFKVISAWGASAGALLLLVGCAGTAMVACFPDAGGLFAGELRWTDIHEKAAITVAVGFVLGIPWHGVLLLRDRFLGGDNGFNHRRLLWPYLFWLTITGVAVFFQTRWAVLYTEMKTVAAASGEHIGSSWAEALNTRYSFPLWENVVIYTLFAFLIWFALALPNDVPKRR